MAVALWLKHVTKRRKYTIQYHFAGGHRDGEENIGSFDSVPDIFIGNSGVDLPPGSYILEAFYKSGDQVLAVYGPIDMNLTEVENEYGEEETNSE